MVYLSPLSMIVGYMPQLAPSKVYAYGKTYLLYINHSQCAMCIVHVQIVGLLLCGCANAQTIKQVFHAIVAALCR